jgi:hypothetical protein
MILNTAEENDQADLFDSDPLFIAAATQIFYLETCCCISRQTGLA